MLPCISQGTDVPPNITKRAASVDIPAVVRMQETTGGCTLHVPLREAAFESTF